VDMRRLVLSGSEAQPTQMVKAQINKDSYIEQKKIICLSIFE